MKTVVVNALSALQGGGQTYLVNLLEHVHDFPELRVIVIAPKHANYLFSIMGIEINSPEFPDRGVLYRALWERFMLPRLLVSIGADVLYCPGGLLPSSVWSCKTAVAFQNMLPFVEKERKRYPLCYMRARLWLLKRLFTSSFSRADLLVFMSKYAKDVIDRELPIRKGNSVVIPHGISDEFRIRSLSRPNSLPEEYVLYVSILDFYKAQIEVIRAWAKLRQGRETHEKLLLVGPEFPKYGRKVRQLIRELGLEKEVLILGNVSYHKLPAYYQHAKINLFASSCENCPNILLEVMASGRPLLLSNYPPMPEFARNGAVYFDPYSPEALSKLLVTYLDNQQLRMDLSERALARSKEFQWKDTAYRTWQALSELANK